MSEPREECYKCLNNQSCPSIADYGSIVCMTRRKFKLYSSEDDSVYAHKFAIMQKQIDKKEERNKELEKENETEFARGYTKCILDFSENYLPIRKIRNKIEELNDGIKRDMINYDKAQEENWKKAIHHSMYQKVEIRKVLENLLEENK